MGPGEKGEAVKLHCARCAWSTEIPMADTNASQVIACVHCLALLYWHRCATCALCYAGSETPACPVCDDSELDDVSFD